MKTNKYIRISSKIIYSSTILIYLAITIILVTSLITIPSSVLSEDENDASDVAIIPEEELESMGLKWTYKRPDGSKDNPSTCWKLRWSPDGTKIAVVYFDNTTVILDGKSGKVINAELGAGVFQRIQNYRYYALALGRRMVSY